MNKTVKTRFQKTITVLLIVFCSFFVLLFTACNSNDNMIDEYRKSKIQEIQSYSESKLQNNYTDENRSLVDTIITTSKNSISNSDKTIIIDTIVIDTKQQLDQIEPLQSDELKNGAYFITETGYEFYTTKHAQINSDNMWVLIVNGQITVSDHVRTSYKIFDKNGIFRGTSLTSNIDIWLLNDVLYLRDANETLQYTLNTNYSASVVSQTEQLATLSNISTTVGDTQPRYVSFECPFDSGYGYFGTAVEIKNADNMDFAPIKIERPYMNLLVVQLFSTDYLTPGDNLVRLYNIGGYCINTNKTVTASLQSAYTVFKITVTNDNITIEQIQN